MTKPIFDNAKERGTEGKIGQLNPLKRPGQPHELAAMGLFLASDEASYVNGQAFPVDGGLTASMPYAASRFESGKKQKHVATIRQAIRRAARRSCRRHVDALVVGAPRPGARGGRRQHLRPGDIGCDCSDRAVFAGVAKFLPQDAVWFSSNLKRTHQTAAAIWAAGLPKRIRCIRTRRSPNRILANGRA